MKSTLVRNADNKLLCELIFEDGRWKVKMLKKRNLTILDLLPDGSVRQEDIPA